MKNLSRYDENLSVPRKQDVDDKQPKIDVDGILQGDGNGNISAAETTQTEAVPIPVGIMKGTADGSVTTATPGTDYALQSLGMSGAVAGQMPVVKTIDTQGRPVEWEPADVSGSDVFIITVGTTTDNGDGTFSFTPDQTYEEVNTTILNGKQCYVKYIDVYYPLASVDEIISDDGALYVTHAIFTVALQGLAMRSITMTNRDGADAAATWTIQALETAASFPSDPSNGQVLYYRTGLNRGWHATNIDTSLATDFTGLIKGTGGKLAQAVPGIDYQEALFTVHITNTGTASSPVWSSDKTYAEIKEAVETGKIAVAIYGTGAFLCRTISTTAALFAGLVSGSSGVAVTRSFTLKPDGSVTSSGINLQTTSARVNTVSGTSTNTQYPTAKAVWDALGARMPAATASDNGKSAVVENGAWSAVDMTPFYVKCSDLPAEGYAAASADKTFSEIFAAYQAGRPCYALITDPNTDDVYHVPLTVIDGASNTKSAEFYFVRMAGQDSLRCAYVYIKEAGGVSETYGSFYVRQLLPSTSSNDNGKFLQVANGVWAATEVSNANGVSF